MKSVISVQEGSKGARFDGMVLELFGLMVQPQGHQVMLENIEKIDIVPSGDEYMLGVKKLSDSGVSLFFPGEKLAEWQTLVEAVKTAQSQAK